MVTTRKPSVPDDAYNVLIALRVYHHQLLHEIDTLKNEIGAITGSVPRVWGEYVNAFFRDIEVKIRERQAELDNTTKAIKDLETTCFGK
jgi:PHP family Zn ribbon phosphoesterase